MRERENTAVKREQSSLYIYLTFFFLASFVCVCVTQPPYKLRAQNSPTWVTNEDKQNSSQAVATMTIAHDLDWHNKAKTQSGHQAQATT